MRQLKITTRVTSKDSYALEKYLIDVNRLKMISIEDDLILAEKINKGDKEALNKLISANLRFVISVVKQYQNQGLPLQDLINEGNLGLIKAAERFDPSKGFKFISYAVWWIRQSVLYALATHGRIIRLPSNKVSLINKIKSSELKLEQKFEREPTQEELAEETMINLESIYELSRIRLNTLYMDSPISNNNNGDELTLYDILGKNNNVNTDNHLMRESLINEITVLLNKLNEREKFIIKSYYGLDGFCQVTIGEIANTLHVSSEQVRKLKKSAIRKLKKYSEELNYKAF